MTMKPILEIQDLTIDYPERAGVVRNANFAVQSEEIMAVVGESGSGKSTLLSAILGLIPAGGAIRGGKILYNGSDLVKLNWEEARLIRGRKIAMVFQNSGEYLNPRRKIGSQYLEMMKYHLPGTKREHRGCALEMLERLHLANPDRIMQSYPFELSGGMRQRIMIAMALVCNPELLICDEPTTALDVTVQAQILGLIRRLQKEKKTSVVFISHDMGVISQMADRVAVMYAGQLVEYAQAEAIFTRPLHPYTQGLQAAIPKMNEKKDSLESIPGNVPMLYELPKGCIFSPRCAYATDRCRSERPQIVEADGHRVRCFLYEQGGDAQRREMKATDTSETKIENKKKIGEEGEG